jgi:hypothetical protein
MIPRCPDSTEVPSECWVKAQKPDNTSGAENRLREGPLGPSLNLNLRHYLTYWSGLSPVAQLGEGPPLTTPPVLKRITPEASVQNER